MSLAQIAVGVVVAVHYAVMAFIVFGGFLVWRWPRLAWAHLLIIGWAVLSLMYPNRLACPLTMLENYFRRLSGAGDVPVGFIDTYIKGVLYPENLELGVQILCGLIVVVSWGGAYLRWRQHRPRVTPPVEEIKLGH